MWTVRLLASGTEGGVLSSDLAAGGLRGTSRKELRAIGRRVLVAVRASWNPRSYGIGDAAVGTTPNERDRIAFMDAARGCLVEMTNGRFQTLLAWELAPDRELVDVEALIFLTLRSLQDERAPAQRRSWTYGERPSQFAA